MHALPISCVERIVSNLIGMVFGAKNRFRETIPIVEQQQLPRLYQWDGGGGPYSVEGDSKAIADFDQLAF
jgi:hypothetical protein